MHYLPILSSQNELEQWNTQDIQRAITLHSPSADPPPK